MNELNISDKLIALRHQKKITQGELASFLGITKASVSKWETQQSYPDITFLPQIATYFGVSIDELLSFEPQLSQEQMKGIYLELADDFIKNPFDTVIEECKKLVKQYYACFPFLKLIVILWMNHFMLTEDQGKQREVLEDIINLCDHICEGTTDMSLKQESLMYKAAINLQLGNAQKVIDDFETEKLKKDRVEESYLILAQAYQMVGQPEEAELLYQINLYSHLLDFTTGSIQYLNLQMGDKDRCETTIKRITQLIEAYEIEYLHPNTVLQFHYFKALFYCTYEEKESALKEVEYFIRKSIIEVKKGFILHGDGYFNRVEEWFTQMSMIGVGPPRNPIVIMESLIPALRQPGFQCLFENHKYQYLMKCLDQEIAELKESKS